MSSLRARGALVVGSAAALVGGVVGARTYFEDSGSTTGTAGAGTAVYECPMAGALSIGEVHEGDTVWLIGVTGGRWAVIRHPQQPDRPAWMPMALVSTGADTGDLPELGCADAVDLAGGAPTESTAIPTDDSTPTSISGSTTTIGSTTTSTSTTTTVAGDTTGPTVTLTPSRDFLVLTPPGGECGTLLVTAVVDDPTLPLSIVSAQATWSVKGVEHEQALVVSGYKFTLTVDKASGPPSGSVPLTITIIIRDGLNNRTTATLPITLRASGGC